MEEDHVTIELSQKPKKPIIIEGFPGFGLIGTIATEYLVEQLKCEKIGKVYFEDLPATIAIHQGKLIDPVSIYYSKKYNIVIIHSITAASGIEWLAAEVILKLCKDLEAKELISIEGVGTTSGEGDRTFYYSNDSSKRVQCLKGIGVSPLDEGIIMGVTSSLLIKGEDFPITALFAETHSNLPDSKAAANVIKLLDKCLGLDIDPQPLVEQAEKFEEKLRTILEKSAKTVEEADKKKTSYIA